MVDKTPQFSFPLEQSTGYWLRKTHRSFARAMQQRIEPRGVTIGMWYFLRILWEEDGLTQRELSQRIEMMEPTTATALRNMEERNLVRRVRNPTDKRKVNIYLTEEGRALRNVLLPHAKAVDAAALAGVTEADIACFHRVLHQMRVNLGPAGDADEI
ncbi:MAG TPA: MarR family transcriptional regulator [Aliidongia sp.]|nr:MarR family transcriptional regulator [Aliidongia sp.]